MAGAGLLAPVGIGDEVAGGCHQIGGAISENLLGQGRIADCTHGLDDNVALKALAHLTGQPDIDSVVHIGQRNGETVGIGIVHSAAAALDDVDQVGQIVNRFGRVVQCDTALGILADRKAHLNDHLVAHFVADALEDHAGETGAVFPAAAILVGAVVGDGREECTQQPVVTAMDIDDVKTAAITNQRSIGKAICDTFHFFHGHGADGALGGNAVAGTKQVVAVDGLAQMAAVVELQRGQRTVGVDGIRKGNQCGGAGAVMGEEVKTLVIGAEIVFGVNTKMPGVYDGSTAAGDVAVIADGGFSEIGQARSAGTDQIGRAVLGRSHKAAADGLALDGDGAEQMGIGLFVSIHEVEPPQ